MQTTPAMVQIVALPDLLTLQSLRIPIYQRPYQWGSEQVLQLLADIEQQCLVSPALGPDSYRLGTVVLHSEKQGGETQVLNIVDGQQRSVTLLLVLHAIRAQHGHVAAPVLEPRGVASAVVSPAEVDAEVYQQLAGLQLFEPNLDSSLSQRNVRDNYALIARHLRQTQWGATQIRFLLRRCEVVLVRLKSLAEAFQFFDAQNARGKDLCAHDLLKAYHLRALRPGEETHSPSAVQAWERCSQDELQRLFARFLFQVRRRTRTLEAESFGKLHVGSFKGLRLDAKAASFPMANTWRMLDDAVHLIENHGDKRGAVWPCQLDAPVVNGLRFFDWVQHYWHMDFHKQQEPDQLPPWVQQLERTQELKLDAEAHRILLTLGRYQGHWRKGDGHVRAVFDALLMYYVDKFGGYELSRAVKQAFVWAYWRLLDRRVLTGSMDKFVRECLPNPFAVLRDAMTPQAFWEMELAPATYKKEDPVAGLDPLKALMQTLGYWKEAEHGERT